MVKNFIGRNRPLGHADQLYTYKGHILSVGLTEKWQKNNKNSHFEPKLGLNQKTKASLFYKTFNFSYTTTRKSHSENFLLNKIKISV